MAGALEIACAVDLAHAAGTDHGFNFEVAHSGSRPQQADCREPEEAGAHLVIPRQQHIHFAAQVVVGAAGLLEEGVALTGLQLQSLVEQVTNLLMAFRCHVPALWLISRYSQSLAVSQWRFTVAVEIPMASAVSSMESPAKNRSSTIRLCCGSSLASSLSASSSATTSKSRVFPPRSSVRDKRTPPSRFAALRARAYSTRIWRMS